jgi:hypothetical protein
LFPGVVARCVMGNDSDVYYYVRPEEVRGEIRLKRFRELEYLAFFVCGIIVFYFLYYGLHVLSATVCIAFFICFLGAGFFGLLTLISLNFVLTYYRIVKILFTDSGIALADRKGKVRHMVPFARVTNVRCVYSETVASAALDLRARSPRFVQFDLMGGERFTILMDYIVKADQEKLFRYLPAFRR